MTPAQQTARARPGDVIVIEGHRLGEPQRLGEILEVLGGEGHEHYRVHWDDDRESVFYPGNDATVKPGTHRRRQGPVRKRCLQRAVAGEQAMQGRRERQ